MLWSHQYLPQEGQNFRKELINSNKSAETAKTIEHQDRKLSGFYIVKLVVIDKDVSGTVIKSKILEQLIES